MPKFLENRLKREAQSKGMTGRQADSYVYGTMNNLGAMHGSAETAKGRRMDAKHAKDMARPARSGHPHKNLGTYLHPKKG